MKVSVLINNHNYGSYIGEAIESVLNQTYRDFEIIVVDGASTDDSRDVIMSYVERYPRLITAVFRPASGQAAAINAGFALSTGEVIALLDSDDYFLENKLERIVEAHKSYTFVGHGRKTLSYKGDPVDFLSPMDDPSQRSKLLHQYGYLYTYNISTSCISATRKLLEQILPMPEDGYVTHADPYLKLMGQYYGEIAYLREPLTFYRIHRRQKSKEVGGPIQTEELMENLYRQVLTDANRHICARGGGPIPPLTRESLQEAFALANPGTSVREGGRYILYGTGYMGQRMLRHLGTMGAHCCYAADSSPEKWGSVWNGIRILPLPELRSRRDEYDQILIASNYYQEMEENLAQLGLVPGIDYVSLCSVPLD